MAITLGIGIGLPTLPLLGLGAVLQQIIVTDNGDGTGRIVQYPTCPQISVTDNGDGTGKVSYA